MSGDGRAGRISAIARRAARRLPMEEVARVRIDRLQGVSGDHKGRKFPRRAVTILAMEDWQAALNELQDLAGPVALPWTARRANLLVEGLRLPRAIGASLTVGNVRLEVTAQTVPCARMEEAHPGLMRALHPEWRGGVTCRVLTDGEVSVGDAVRIEYAPVEHVRRLP